MLLIGHKGTCKDPGGDRNLFHCTSEDSFGLGKWLFLVYSLPLKCLRLLLNVNDLTSFLIAVCQVGLSAVVISQKSAVTPHCFKLCFCILEAFFRLLCLQPLQDILGAKHFHNLRKWNRQNTKITSFAKPHKVGTFA